MPKKPPKNAFFFYMLHFKDQEARKGRHYGGLNEISNAASDSWKKMNAQQRGPFEKRAKEDKFGPRKEVEKFTSQGIPLSMIEKEQKDLENAHRTMIRTIKSIVQNAFTDNTIGSSEFYFISGNYFVNVNETYYPAELAMVKFTFANGIVSKFHTYINPEKLPLGYQFSAKEYSEKSHRLPIPPNAKGERDYRLILDEIDKFMNNSRDIPPIFTMKEEIPVIESFMREFCENRGNGDEDPGRYRVYPLHQLFYDIKEQAVINTGESFRSIHIAEALLNRDHYAYLKDTACNYHEELDVVKFCALANVQKWSSIFSDHICVDLNIEPVSGQHFPPEIDLTHMSCTYTSNMTMSNTTMSSSKLNDSENATYTVEDKKQRPTTSANNVAPSHWGGRSKSPDLSTRDEDFPSLGSRRAGPSKKRSEERNTYDPWNTSSSSSGSGSQWNQRRATQLGCDTDTDESRLPSLGRGSRADRSVDSSVSRGMGRGSRLFLNVSGFGRDNDRSSKRKRSPSPRRTKINRSWSPRRSERERSPSPRRSERKRSPSPRGDRNKRYDIWHAESKDNERKKRR